MDIKSICYTSTSITMTEEQDQEQPPQRHALLQRHVLPQRHAPVERLYVRYPGSPWVKRV